MNAIECRKQISDIMKKHGYYNKIMSLDHLLPRVKNFLHELEKSTVQNIPESEDKNLPFPRLMPLFPGLTNQFLHDSNTFPAVKILEENFNVIREEALALDTEKNFVDYRIKDMVKGNWQVHLFSYMGINVEKTAQLCPKTASLLNQLPNRCQIYPWGDAVFSALNPGAHIPAHYSVDNLRVRCMFGIVIPDGCEMRVGTIRTSWQEGKALLFEDSFEHEVWHNGKERRIVLIFDFWHPDLLPIEIEALSAGFSHPEVRRKIYNFLEGASEDYNFYLSLASEKGFFSKNFHNYWDSACLA